MPNVMATFGIQVVPSVKYDDELKFRNSIPCTTLQSLADADGSSAVHVQSAANRTQDLDA